MVDGKLTYYAQRGLVPELARRYHRQFAGARRILDVGCGTGDFARFKPSPEIRIFGVDIDPIAVARAADVEDAACVDLEHESLPFDDATFDAVLARDVLEHLTRPWEVAAEILRVLKPGGVLVASVVMAKPRRVWADYTHVRGFSRAAARGLLTDVGFEVESVVPMGPVPLSNRLRFVSLLPYLLQVPGLSHLWAASWELKATRP